MKKHQTSNPTFLAVWTAWRAWSSVMPLKTSLRMGGLPDSMPKAMEYPPISVVWPATHARPWRCHANAGADIK
jgi:hypothetical protein